MGDEDVKAELERLKTENEALEAAINRCIDESERKRCGFRLRIGRFPVTLYQEQWNKLLSMADEIEQFIADNQNKLKVKEG
jgi:hypothetical protein